MDSDKNVIVPRQLVEGGYTGIALSVCLSIRLCPEHCLVIFLWIFLKLPIRLCHYMALCTCDFGHNPYIIKLSRAFFTLFFLGFALTSVC